MVTGGRPRTHVPDRRRQRRDGDRIRLAARRRVLAAGRSKLAAGPAVGDRRLRGVLCVAGARYGAGTAGHRGGGAGRPPGVVAGDGHAFRDRSRADRPHPRLALEGGGGGADRHPPPGRRPRIPIPTTPSPRPSSSGRSSSPRQSPTPCSGWCSAPAARSPSGSSHNANGDPRRPGAARTGVQALGVSGFDPEPKRHGAITISAQSAARAADPGPPCRGDGQWRE